MLLKRFFSIGASVILLLLGCSCNPVADTKAEAEKIRQLDNEWVAATKAGDVEKIMNLFAPDAVSMDPGAPILIGLPAIRKSTEDWLSDKSVTASFKETIDAIEVSTSGDLAWDRGTYTILAKTPFGEKEDGGKWVNIWRNIDGQWKVILGISNSNQSDKPKVTSEELVSLFTKIENDWNTATQNKDAAALDQLLGEEYTYVDSRDIVSDKKQSINDVTSGKLTWTAPGVISDLIVNLYGEVAVVKGKNTIKGTFGGKNISGTYRFVDVFVWRDGRWQCVSTK